MTISLKGLILDDYSVPTKSQSNTKLGNTQSDKDECIGESDVEARTSHCDNPAEGGSGPLRSSCDNPDEIHQMIGECVVRHLEDNTECAAGSTHSSCNDTPDSTTTHSLQTSAASSQHVSPDHNSQDSHPRDNSDAEDSNDEDIENADDEEYRRYFNAAMQINTETCSRSEYLFSPPPPF